MSNSQSACHKVNNPNPPTNHKANKLKYRLRAVASKCCKGMLDKKGNFQKVCSCGHTDGGDKVTFGINAHGKSVILGVVTCKSVWTCAVCADKITASRRDALKDIISGYQYQEKGAVYMLALTIPHNIDQSLEHVAGNIKRCWNKFVQSGAYPKIKQQYDLQGYVKTLETTTNTGAGWHPHFHLLFFVKQELTEQQRQDVENRLFERWALLVNKQGMGSCNRGIFRFEKAISPNQASDYILKANIASEMTGWHKKVARGGGYTPFALLDVILSSNNPNKKAWAKKLFREYAEYFKGSRYTTYSKDLKRKYGIRDDNDDEIIEQETDTDITPKVHLSKYHYMVIFKNGAIGDLQQAIEQGYEQEILSKYNIKNLDIGTYEKIPLKTDWALTWGQHLSMCSIKWYFETQRYNKTGCWYEHMQSQQQPEQPVTNDNELWTQWDALNTMP